MKKSKVLPVIYFGDPRLRTVCSFVEVFHKGLHTKIDNIAYTLKKHGGGAALAAPQVAILKRIIVINYFEKYYELVNPEITDQSGEEVDVEGCLSLPNYWGNVKRYKHIQVKYQDRFGDYHEIETNGQMARCFQHEIDHLNGMLYIDRVVDDFVVNEVTKEKVPVKHLLELTRQ